MDGPPFIVALYEEDAWKTKVSQADDEETEETEEHRPHAHR